MNAITSTLHRFAPHPNPTGSLAERNPGSGAAARRGRFRPTKALLAFALALGLVSELQAQYFVVNPGSIALGLDAPGAVKTVTFVHTFGDSSSVYQDVNCYIHDPNPPMPGEAELILPAMWNWTYPCAGNPPSHNKSVTMSIKYPTTPGYFVKQIAVFNDYFSISHYVTVTGEVSGSAGLNDYASMTGVVPVFSPVTGGLVTEPLSGNFHRVRFKATYSGIFASSWNWYVDLYHTTGMYRIQLVDTQFSAKECFGDLTTAFALPGNRTWLRDASNHIIAKVSADCTESDSGTTYVHHCEYMAGIVTPPNRPWLHGGFGDKLQEFKGDLVTLSFGGGGATGYKVYYGRGSATNGTGAKQGRSPIDVKAGTTLTLTGMDFRDIQFAVKAVNAAGESELSASVRATPSIIWQPVGETVAAGSRARFAVRAAGAPPLTYQWRLNGKGLPGATKAAYSVEKPQKDEVGTYDVVVTNSVGTVTSTGARLVLGDPVGPKK